MRAGITPCGRTCGEHHVLTEPDVDECEQQHQVQAANTSSERADQDAEHGVGECDEQVGDGEHDPLAGRVPSDGQSAFATTATAALRAVLETYAVLSREKHGSELAELLNRGEHDAHVHQHLHVFLQASLPRPSWREASVPTLPPMNSRSIASTPSPLPAN